MGINHSYHFSILELLLKIVMEHFARFNQASTILVHKCDFTSEISTKIILCNCTMKHQHFL